ncbi:M1 family metallopeptidase [Chitinophaga japonensis]|uniref:Peptidase M1-like protein n=1 Tax=Chitinophaga japonensis TaxID=104662 RepID=A0A562SYN2_CHIJA|nr:M1 family metallopeptidase [Chitinophaga japonensis]TWI86402.1 peptidase M1-like protein [Chitinophaga japonensis]
MKRLLWLLLPCIYSQAAQAQPWNNKTHLTRQDTLRGSITPERAWWDVLRYDLCIQPSFTARTLAGHNNITYKVLQSQRTARMQVDLRSPLHIDSALINHQEHVPFAREGDVWYLHLKTQNKNAVNTITIYYSGRPHEAAQPPWDGGWIWGEDSLHRPWMTVACQGIGASTWYPCKDHQGDEPDNGASLAIRVPDTLAAIANGRLQSKRQHPDHTVTYKWAVTNPINNYNLCPYIGKYMSIDTVYQGQNGHLSMRYHVLDYNYQKARAHLLPHSFLVMECFEHWFGPYPFYEDGYQLVDAPGYGMEHQSAIAYGNGYRNGHHGRDYSGTGWGMQWDFLLVHESAHEWFGNNITARDPADKWIQESFACYADVLYMKDLISDAAGSTYVIGTRRNIRNDAPITGPYGVGREGSSDMYPKGRNLLHMIRRMIHNDDHFREILTGMNRDFRHQTVTSRQIEDYLIARSGIDLSPVFDQYLRTPQVPVFEYRIGGRTLAYRFTNCVPHFSMPLLIKAGGEHWITPRASWQELTLPHNIHTITVDSCFYVGVQARL